MKFKMWMLVGWMVCVAGCPLGPEPSTNNPPAPDAGVEPDTTPEPDMAVEPDASADMAPDMEVVPELACTRAWPTERTVPRDGQARVVTMQTLCRGGDTEGLGASLTLREGEPLEAASVTSEPYGESQVRVSMAFELPGTLTASRDIPVTGLKLGELELGAQAPRTHLTPTALQEQYAPAAQATTPLTGVLGATLSTIAGAPKIFALVREDGTGGVNLREAALGATDQQVVAELPFGRVDEASLTYAKNGDGGARLFGVVQCLDVRAVPCQTPLGFVRTSINEGGQVTQTLTLSGDAIAELPPALLSGASGAGTLVYSELVADNSGGAKLRVLYAANDTLKGVVRWVVVDAFDTTATRTPTLRRVALFDDIGGVTPEMVASGVASVGLVRAPTAPSLDSEQFVGESDLWLWTATIARGGGATISMPFEDTFKATTFVDIEPASAQVRSVYWGERDRRALVVAGTDARRVPKAHVGLFGAGEATYRPLQMPTAPMAAGSGVDVVVGADGSAAAFARFGVVIGINNTKKDPPAPLDALLDGEDVSSMAVFGGGGEDLKLAAPIEPQANVPVYLADGEVKGGAALSLSGGVAVVEPVDAGLCERDASACEIPRAVSSSGFRVQSTTGPGGVDTMTYALGAGGGGSLFTSSPGYAFLMSKRAVVADVSGPEVGHVVVVPFEEAGKEGLYYAAVGRDGQLGNHGALSRETADGAPLPYEGSSVLSLGDGGVVFAERRGDGPEYEWILFYDEVDDIKTLVASGDDDAGTITVTATIQISYQNADGQLKVPRTCPMAHPSCAMASSRFSKGEDSAGFPNGRRPIDDTVDVVLRAAPSGGGSAAVMVIAEWETGTPCELATLLYPDVKDAGADPVVVSTSDRRDCADLAVPVAVGDVMGLGSQQFVLLRQSGEGGMTSVVYVGEGAQGQDTIFHADFGAVSSALNVGTLGAARAVWLVDLNDDGLPEVTFDPSASVDSFAVPRTAPVGSARVNLGTELRGQALEPVPGLSVHGVGGVRDAPGGIQQRGIGRGTRLSTGRASTRAELL